MQLHLSKIQKILFFSMIFFVVFDGVRSNLVISNIISPLRELGLGLFILSCLPFLKKCKRSDVYLSLTFLGLSFAAIVNLPITLLNDISSSAVGSLSIFGNKYSAIYKHIIFSLILLCLLSYARKEPETMDKGINLFINLSVIYAIITIPIYLYGFPLFTENFRDWGRMGIGYPTMDGQIFCFSMLCLIFFSNQKSSLHFNLKMAALLLGIAAQNTGTAMVTLVLIVASSLVKKPKKTITYISIIIPLIVIIAIKQYWSNPDFFTNMLYIVNLKFTQLLHPEMASSDSINTLQIRAMQYDKLNQIMNTDIMLRIFGVGGQAYIENEFRLTLASYGIFAFIFFALTFLWLPFVIISQKNRNKLILLVIVVMWAFTSFTLASIFLFATSFCFCLVFSYAFVKGQIDNMH